MPSLRYSLLESPLTLVNGKTARESIREPRPWKKTSQTSIASTARIPPPLAIAVQCFRHGRLITEAGVTLTEAELAESISRFSRWRSARSSGALWYRSLQSFSSALLIIRSSSGDISGFRRAGAIGAHSRIA